MATIAATLETPPPGPAGCAALQRGPWRTARLLSRGLAAIEAFLSAAGFDRLPWLAVAFGSGIAGWFALPTWAWWTGLSIACFATAIAGLWFRRRLPQYYHVGLALVVLPLVVAAGVATVWTRSEVVGARPVEAASYGIRTGRVLAVQPQPALERDRYVLAMREPGSSRAIRVRINVAHQYREEPVHPGDVVRLPMRLLPPSPAMLPGAYDFARTAWFSGLSATGSATGSVEVISRDGTGRRFAQWRSAISSHVRDKVPGRGAGIAATLATGDRGGIAPGDAQAMRDSGLAHLLSISGLHVSAVIGAVYLLVLRLLALNSWLALRVRLPLLAAGAGAFGGLAYTLMTGAQVPTVRSCVGALLVLAALALGREALSFRMLAVAAFVVLLLWPESLVGPSFQMSFAAVLAIVTLSRLGPVSDFMRPREEGAGRRFLRHIVALFVTGFVIELALMPIALFHFHRAGLYGALANVMAIPLTTFIVMPLVAAGLVLDLVGLGGPVWWLCGEAIEALLSLAYWVSSRPGAVTVLPSMGSGAFAAFIFGGLWFALWTGRVRYLGLVPALLGALLLARLEAPDILISGDGRHLAVVDESGEHLNLLRDTRSDYIRDNFLELAGIAGNPRRLTQLPQARCNTDFCTVPIDRGGERLWILASLGHLHVPKDELARACANADIVVSDRWLPASCRPRWLKADKRMLRSTGGLSIRVSTRTVRTVAEAQGQHGWWAANRR